jgi:hypothetical protein
MLDAGDWTGPAGKSKEDKGSGGGRGSKGGKPRSEVRARTSAVAARQRVCGTERGVASHRSFLPPFVVPCPFPFSFAQFAKQISGWHTAAGISNGRWCKESEPMRPCLSSLETKTDRWTPSAPGVAPSWSIVLRYGSAVRQFAGRCSQASELFRIRRYPLGIRLSFIFLVRAFGASALASGARRYAVLSATPSNASQIYYIPHPVESSRPWRRHGQCGKDQSPGGRKG